MIRRAIAASLALATLAFAVSGSAATWRFARLLDLSGDADAASPWMEGDGDELYCKANLSTLTTGSVNFSIQFCRLGLTPSSPCIPGTTGSAANAVTLASTGAQSAVANNAPMWVGPFTPTSAFVPGAAAAIAPVPAIWRVFADVTGTNTGAVYVVDCYWR